jgi:hypothetical protein
MSLMIPFRREIISPNPIVRSRRGTIVNGININLKWGVIPYPMNKMPTKTKRIKNGMIDWPAEAITRDFLEKLIFRIIGPALINEFELPSNPVENNCQNARPSRL